MEARAELDRVIEQALRAAFPDVTFGIHSMPIDEICIRVPASHLIPVVALLSEGLGVWHLSTITADHPDAAEDACECVRLLYHFWHGRGITLSVDVPIAALRVPTLTTLIPGAAFYEREVFGMFGVDFEGHPNLRPLLLPDGWEGAPPMLSGAAAASGKGDKL